MTALLARSLAVVLALLAAGCANHPFAALKFAPGSSREAVQQQLGTPTRVVALPSGQRLQYSMQPAGQYAVMVDFDAAGRLVSARQVLQPAEFARIEEGRWTRNDVEREFGRPARVDRAWSWQGDIMTYRWTDGSDMFFFVYLDPANVVRRTQQGMEFVNAPDHD